MTRATHPRWLPESVARAWDRAAPRERLLVAGGGAIVLLALASALVWQPLTRDIERSREQLSRDASMLRNARAMADESAGLARDAKTPRAGDPRAAVERVLAEQSLRAGASIEVADGRVKVVLPAVRFAGLVAALDAMRKDDGLRAVEAMLAARVEPGTVRAEFVLAR